MTRAASSAESPGRAHQASASELRERLAADRRGDPYLLTRDAERRQLLVALEGPGPIVIGRAPSAHIRLRWDEDVSRVHAKLECLAEHWALIDDGMSLNGTFVNHERVRGRRVLVDGDTIRMGETHIVFRAPRPPEVKTTSPTPRGPGLPITPAQRRVLVALCRPFADGRRFATAPSNAEIGEELCLSIEAVKGHLRLLFRAFGVANVDRDRRRTALAERAFATGTVGPRDFDPSP